MRHLAMRPAPTDARRTRHITGATPSHARWHDARSLDSDQPRCQQASTCTCMHACTNGTFWQQKWTRTAVATRAESQCVPLGPSLPSQRMDSGSRSAACMHACTITHQDTCSTGRGGHAAALWTRRDKRATRPTGANRHCASGDSDAPRAMTQPTHWSNHSSDSCAQQRAAGHES